MTSAMFPISDLTSLLLLKNHISFFESFHHPYYIACPDYAQKSSGPRVLHYLCHTLNELGYEAYITAGKTSPWLRTPKLTQEIQDQHLLTNRVPVVVYPEVVRGNPLNGTVIARWILNRAGHLGGEHSFGSDELLFYWDEWVLQGEKNADRLYLDSVNSRLFNTQDTDDQNRSGSCFYAHKYLVHGGTINPWLTENSTSLCQDIPRSPEQIAHILKTSRVLYCYEPSNLIAEAYACGCPAVIINTPYIQQFDLAKNNIPIIDEKRIPSPPLQIVGDQFREDYKRNIEKSWLTIENFVARTQEAAQEKAHSKRSAPLTQNKFPSVIPDVIDQDGAAIANHMHKHWQKSPSFHLVIRLPRGAEAGLADTLDSLNHQLHSHWFVEVIATTSAPEGIEGITCLRWHSCPEGDDMKSLIDFCVAAARHDFIAELPPGAILDPFCLWRLADEINKNPDTSAFYVDDDLVDVEGIRNTPRYKPDTNPEWFYSQDLAGPLFIKRSAWREIGGASRRSGSPWFDQLLRILKLAGPGALAHIPDLLISYREKFPGDIECCQEAILSPDSPLTGSEVIPVSEISWRICHPHRDHPPVSIAVISQGQLEFLQACLDSLNKSTLWPEIELLVLRQEDEDHDLNTWLGNFHFRSGTTRQVFLNPDASHAEACNAGIVSASNELVVLLREDTLILDPNWLSELVRTIGTPRVAGVSPRLVRPGNGKIAYAGDVLGLGGEHASPYQDDSHFSERGYLDCLQVARDVSLLADACLLIRRSDYIAVEGMEADLFPQHLATQDLSLKLLASGNRLIYQPQVTLVHYGQALREHFSQSTFDREQQLAREQAAFNLRWLAKGFADPYWNPNLSLRGGSPQPETEFQPVWYRLPLAIPRILARTVGNAQGDYRVASPLLAARRAGLALECIWPQDTDRELTPYELARLAPDVLIAQNYLVDPRLAGLDTWRAAGLDIFTVYALDDLATEMPLSSSLRSNTSANARTRLKYALARCDRMVVSTEFLAETYRHLIGDIRVVPNRLERDVWSGLQTAKREGGKPRIGWAGGTTHLGDLRILLDVIAATRDEADWVFFGMCPDEIRPLIAEFHPGVKFEDYPGKLASLDLDIAVAPLEMNRFNQAKSNLRLLEYGMLGLPVVCTDIDPYRNSPACQVNNETNAWIGAIRERIHDRDAREREGQRMREWVTAGYILEDHLAEWLSAHLAD
ncbi:MAG: hypothetical protein CVU34_13150 [Betaproteobacteria bacterium HGW-Betaproteobacteria-7]|jgi:GT2 family glycosyltransferase|nr:MAG: hypothetical protein CVU34_13150 [Betaproteobacteria bacterium HGW-Betaproteobacteria-7]